MKREHKTSGELPSGFDKLEYIESTGTQYLMTNHYPSTKTHIITDIQYTREDGSKGGFNFVRWSNISGNSRAFGICDASNSNHYIHIYWGEFDHGGHHMFGTNTSYWFCRNTTSKYMKTFQQLTTRHTHIRTRTHIFRQRLQCPYWAKQQLIRHPLVVIVGAGTYKFTMTQNLFMTVFRC